MCCAGSFPTLAALLCHVSEVLPQLTAEHQRLRCAHGCFLEQHATTNAEVNNEPVASQLEVPSKPELVAGKPGLMEEPLEAEFALWLEAFVPCA